MSRVFSYIRFSTADQLAGDSLRRQEDIAQAYCATNNLELDERLTYKDLGLSAYHGANAETGKLA